MEHHAHHHPDPSGRLLFSILLNALITAVEIAGGILSGSLALISDAIHNMSDTLALMLAWVANRVGKRKPDTKKTYGYQRFEILAAFINASVLTSVSLYLIYEAIYRFLHPEPVKSELMLIVAAIGLLANLASMLFLHRDSKESLNVKTAYLHLLGDTLSSVAVVGGAFLIRYTNYSWIDPALTLVISIVIIRQAYDILRESVDILMQSTPAHIDLSAVKTAIESLPSVCNVHHVHCWQMLDRQVFFEAHVETGTDMAVSELGKLTDEIGSMLRDRFSIQHTTLQIEFRNCADISLIRQPG